MDDSGRALLNTLPEWALFMLFAGGTAALCVASLLPVRRLVGTWRSPESSQVLVGVAAMLMTIFALVIAFAVVTLDASFSGARDSVQSEANSLTEIVQDMQVFPPPARLRVDAAVRSYVNEVRGHEFAAMRQGEAHPAAARALDRLVVALQSIRPSTPAQRAFYDAAVTAVGRVLDQRQKRLAAARGSLPQAFWILVFLTAAAGLAMTLLVRVETLAVDVFVVAVIGIVVGSAILTTLLLDYPFSGSVAVSSEPFVRVLEHLPAGAR
jgi:Protein of unknown function (DUF4239)